ncbi:DUF2752 domain-containing protein [Aquipuribacter hungaricus]|uniref:DUF2752 domain-containing protein n=1 Tax=Aquipuribacter hungaricus TaxID=545624 RepID=A0ABV7WCH2_9MICO
MSSLLHPSPAAPSRPGRVQHARTLLGTTLLGPALVAGAAAGSLLFLQVVDPTEPGHLPTCPVLTVTGLFCPGCGTLRMLHHLGDGDLVAAAAMNPLALVLLPVLVLYWLAWVRRTVTGRSRGTPAPAWVVWGFLVVCAVYAVLRNLPGMSVLAPG